MDLQTKSESWGVDDQSWLASRHGLDSARSITLDASAFTKGTHYPDGFLKSGIPLARRAADGLHVPYNTSGSGGAEVLDGHLRSRVGVPATVDSDTRIGAALLWTGVVDVRFLPAPVDADGRAQVAGRIRYENVGG